MQKITYALLVVLIGLITACSTTKQIGDIPAKKSAYEGTWTITDIKTNVPEGFRISNIFDEAPYADFMNSVWTLQSNGNGNFELKNGTLQTIYWSLYTTDSLPMLQFKKLDEGEKARNVETGYRMEIAEKLPTSFILQMPVPVSNEPDGNIRFTFTKT